MSSSTISVALLEALLSPDMHQRKPAEDALQSMACPDRCRALLQALGAVAQPHLQQMVAVLLRRDILRLQDVSMLPALVEPLLAAFATVTSRSAVGDCLAEVCAVLAVMQPNDCTTVIQTILQAIGGQVRM